MVTIAAANTPSIIKHLVNLIHCNVQHQRDAIAGLIDILAVYFLSSKLMALPSYKNISCN